MGLTILWKVSLAKKFSSNNFGHLSKSVALLLNINMKPLQVESNNSLAKFSFFCYGS